VIVVSATGQTCAGRKGFHSRETPPDTERAFPKGGQIDDHSPAAVGFVNSLFAPEDVKAGHFDVIEQRAREMLAVVQETQR